MGPCRDGQHTRFPFLATVRSLVATVVTVLCVAVVVMVIVVLNRPVDLVIRSDGYVRADDWWRIVRNATPAHEAIYAPASEVNTLLILTAVNPSGRGGIKGSIELIGVVDPQNMVQFLYYIPKRYDVISSVNFDLPPHSSHRYRRWAGVDWKDNSIVLRYLYDKHLNDSNGFTVLLVVETTLRRRRHPDKNMSYYCSPVTFLQNRDNLDDVDDVTCKTAQEMGYTPNITLIDS